jgi:two-component system OmpR family sensor kinase
MRRIEGEAERMGVLVEDLLLLAHLDQMRTEPEDVVDVAALAEDACSDARAGAPDREITCTTEEDVEVLGDGDRLLQALANLLSNAIRHTPEGTPIVVEVVRDEDRVVLTVADEGPGLDPETIDHAFERFWRGDPGRTRATGGVGLGLAITAAIAHSHGGEVSARNRSGTGAEFSITLPARS